MDSANPGEQPGMWSNSLAVQVLRLKATEPEEALSDSSGFGSSAFGSAGFGSTGAGSGARAAKASAENVRTGRSTGGG